jgi:hypothetical protein
MSDATKVTPKTGLSTSKKAKALLIALVNLNLIFALVVFKAADVAIAGQMITAILFLAGLFIGVQGGIDATAAWKSVTASSKTTNETITKKYEYKMDYVDGAEK